MRICESCGDTFSDDTDNCPSDGSDLLMASEELIGTKVGRYVLVRLLGKGAMGSVFLGLHPVIKSRVAIKILNTSSEENPEVFRRFVREAQAVNEIGHPNIIKIMDLDTLEDGRPYILMEYMEGQTLRHRMTSKSGMSASEVREILCQVLDALEAAHQSGFVHRDLKPENIYVTNRGQVKLLDFGIAKLTDDTSSATATQTGALLGTPLYLSPEQARGDSAQITPQTDLYAFGIVLYEIYTGGLPFDASNVVNLIVAHLQQEPVPPRRRNPRITQTLETLILKCLRKNHADRPQSAALLRHELISVHDEFVIAGQPTKLPPPTSDNSTPERESLLESAETVASQPGDSTVSSDVENHPATNAQSHRASNNVPNSSSLSRAATGRIVLVQSSPNQTLDPMEAITGEDIGIVQQTHETLIHFDALTGEAEPCLATEWEIDGTVYRFQIRQGVVLHDGSTLTAEMVAASLRKSRKSRLGKGLLWDLDSVEATGPESLLLRTNASSGSFLTRLTSWQGYISKEATPFPIGTGQYKVKSWNPGVGAVVLSAHEHYWGKPPGLKEIVFKTITDESSRLNVLRTDANSIGLLTPYDDIDSLVATGTCRVFKTAPLLCVNLNINNRSEGLDDVAARQALSLAIDSERIVRELYRGRAVVATGFIPPGLRVMRSDVPLFKYNPDGARRALAKSSLRNRPLKLLLIGESTASTPRPELAAELLKANFGEVGLSLEVDFLPMSAFLAPTTMRSYDFTYLGLAADYPDPESYYYYLSRDGFDAGFNWSQFDDDTFNQSFQNARAEMNPHTRLAHFAKMEKRLRDEIPFIPIAHMGVFFALGNNVGGIDGLTEESRGELPPLTDVHLKSET